MGKAKGLYTRGPYSYPFRWDQNCIRAEHYPQGRDPNDPGILKAGTKWFDPIALAPALAELRAKFPPPSPKDRIYLKRY